MANTPAAELERLKAEARGIVLARRGADLVTTPAKNLWHCLGVCQAGGSVVDGVMRAEGACFRHAVERLRAGYQPSVSLSEDVPGAQEDTQISAPYSAPPSPRHPDLPTLVPRAIEGSTMAIAMEVRETEVVAKATRRRFTAEYERVEVQEEERAERSSDSGLRCAARDASSHAAPIWRRVPCDRPASRRDLGFVYLARPSSRLLRGAGRACRTASPGRTGCPSGRACAALRGCRGPRR